MSLSPGHHGCHVALWGATGSGVVLLVLGGVAVGLRRRGATLALLAGATLAGLVTLLSSTVFPGMCRLATMACRRGTQPALVLVGVALVLFGGVGLWRVARRP